MSTVRERAGALPDIVYQRRNAAYALAKEGFQIIHIPEGQKNPDGMGWQKRGVTDRMSINEILRSEKDQFGVYPPSGSGLLIVDEDKQGALDALGDLPDTLIVLTGSGHGRHVYLKIPPGVSEDDIPRSWSGGEVRVSGSGQCVGPWSKHPSGGTYTPMGMQRNVSTAPMTFVNALIREGKVAKLAKQGVTVLDGGAQIGAGGRHACTTAKSRALVGLGLKGTTLLQALLDHDAQHHNPSLLSEGRGEEIAEIARSAERKFEPDPEMPFVFEFKGGATLEDAPNDSEGQPKTTGRRGASTLLKGNPPPLLLDGWLHPEGTTILYGKGGVGKGITACWFAVQLARAGHRVLIVDYENHEREWGQRLESMGYTPNDLDEEIQYVSPYDAKWTFKKGPLLKVADIMHEEAERMRATYVIVDSYSTATTTSDSLGGQEAAMEMASALVALRRPSLVLAHVAGGQSKHPDRPFGSVFVHNIVARWTWSVEEESNIEADPMRFPPEPHIVTLEFRNQKHNDGPRQRDRHVQFSFMPFGEIEVEEIAAVRPPKPGDMIDSVFVDGMSVKDVSREIKTVYPDASVSEDTIRNNLDRVSFFTKRLNPKGNTYVRVVVTP